LAVFVTIIDCPFLSTLWSRPKNAATRWTIIRSSKQKKIDKTKKIIFFCSTWIHCLKLIRLLFFILYKFLKNFFEC
jgi:hypothetical protein